VAVVYAVMLEMGLNGTSFGKAVLAACFVNDLGTVIALGLIFAPFTYRTIVFNAASVVVLGVLPWVTPRFFRAYGGRPSELEAKFLFLALFAMGALAAWADSEAVLVDQTQYSFLIAAVIGSAVVPTLVANAFFLPRYLLPRPTTTNAPPTTRAAEETNL
jgi:hypothetical protein